jgi:hypothetical protein
MRCERRIKCSTKAASCFCIDLLAQQVFVFVCDTYVRKINNYTRGKRLMEAAQMMMTDDDCFFSGLHVQLRSTDEF